MTESKYKTVVYISYYIYIIIYNIYIYDARQRTGWEIENLIGETYWGPMLTF